MTSLQILWFQLWRRIVPNVSPDYRAWRQTFLRNRLRLAFWLAILCCLTFMALNSYAYFANPQSYTANRVASHHAFVSMYGATLLSLLICLGISCTRMGRRHPGWIFVGLSWSNLLPYQVFATLHGIADPRIEAWSLLFPTQAALMPICLPLHLISQLGLVLYFLGVNSLLGLTIHHQPVYSHLTLWLWLFWLFVICDLAVYLYEKLQQSEFENQRSLRLFIHAVSHDLRSPVIGTSMVFKNLLQDLTDHKICINEPLLQRLLQGNNRQLTLIDSLLETHRTEVQGMCISVKKMRVCNVVDAALTDFSEILAEAKVCVENRVGSDLPWVKGDDTQLWRVYSNLINNAIRHNPVGIRLTLDATSLKIGNGQWLRCTVEDNGVGIAPKQQTKLFELYARSHRAEYRSGLGLGLYLCRQIVVAHGGDMGVVSVLGEFTTFWFTLPVVDSSAVDESG